MKDFNVGQIEFARGARDVTAFDFESQPVRVFEQDGEPWFVAKDIAEALGYTDAWNMTRRLDEDEFQNLQIRGFGNRGVSLVNESGLYAAILGSSKPAAKRFKKWVTAEVLPSLRKTGQYGAGIDLRDPDQLLPLLNDYAQAAKAAKGELAAVRPQAQAYERLAISDGDLCITDAAKTLGLRPKDLFAWLQAHQWIYRRTGGNHWCGYQDKIQRGLLNHKVTEVIRPDGSQRISIAVRITAKGLSLLAKLHHRN